MESFTFEFQEEKPNRITFDYSPEADEQLDSAVENGVPIVYANRSALLTLAKLFIKMAKGPYSDGFHIHLRKDLDADEGERLIVMLHQSAENAAGERVSEANVTAD
jgi:hypothetical protein